jgi:hypothetical protein
METFPIVKAKDMEGHGIYRTKETILKLYAEFAMAEPGRATVDINRMSMIVVLLLQGAKAASHPTSRDDLTLGLALFFNDAARKAVLGQSLSDEEKRQLDDLPEYIVGLNSLVARQIAQGLIREHEGLYLPGPSAPPFNHAPSADQSLVQQVVRGIDTMNPAEKTNWTSKLYVRHTVSQ